MNLELVHIGATLCSGMLDGVGLCLSNGLDLVQAVFVND